MSTVVDERVVSMQFDNRYFEENVHTSMSTLDKLKQSLRLDGAAKGLENVNAAAKSNNFGILGSAAEQVGIKFSGLWTIADQTLRNITNSVEHTAKKIVSSFTIDPIKTGFQEYETQINAVQTILANTESKGTTLQDVNRALDELNTYADKTIYNFTQMTKNIGTFTAAGVDLDTSVSAIQGIANLAAVSGSTSQQASTAMYQLSQALAAGKVSLMDWNSVVNAGMGGQVFQDALKRTATNMGKDVDGLIKKYGSFRESLTQGEWLTTDVLTETLRQFTMAAEEGSEEWENYKKSLMDTGYSEEQALSILKMANTATDAATKVKTFTQLIDTLKESVQSGWTQSWEIIMGDFGEAKEFLTEVSNRLGEMIGSSADARNKMLSGGLSTGWKQLLNEGIADEEGFKETLISVADESGVALDKMIAKAEETGGTFEDALADGLKSGKISSDMLTESVHKMADKMSKMSAEELKAAGYTQEHVKEIKELSAGLKDGSVSMDDFVKKMTSPSGRENLIQSLWNSFDGLMSVITPVREAFREIFPPITGEQLYSFTENLVKLTEKLTLSDETAANLKSTFKGIFAVLDIVRQAFVAVAKAILPLFGTVGDLSGGILGVTASWGEWLVKLNESIKKGDTFGKAIKKVSDFLKPIIEDIKQFGTTVSEAFSSAFDTVSAFTGKASVRLEPLTILGNFIKSIFTGLGNVLKVIAPFVFEAAKGIGNVLSDLMDTITSGLQNANFDALFDFANGGIITAIGLYIAKFVGNIADATENVDNIVEKIRRILDGISNAFTAFTESIKANTLKTIATAIAILAGALLVLALIPSDKLTSALVAVSTLFAELMGSMTVFSKLVDGKSIKNIAVIGKTLTSLAMALLILSVALKIMSTMSWSEMGVGLISITVGIGVLVGAVNLLPKEKVNKAAKAIRTLSSSMVILAVAIKILSTMSWEEMGIGLISMVVGLGALVGAVNLLPKDSALKSAGMIALATSMVILAAALKIMATLSWGEIGKSLVALVGALAAITVAMNLMIAALPGAAAMLVVAPALVILAAALKIMATLSWGEIGKSLVALAGALAIIAVAMTLMIAALPGAAAMLVVAGALAILTPVLWSLGSMSWEEITKGLASIAGAFTVLGLAALILKPLVPTILSLSASLALLGVACLAVGVGVMALGAGLTAIAAAGSGVAVAVVAIVSGLVGLIPYVIEQIGVGIIKLCEVIAGSADAICKAVTVIILAVVDALVVSVPALVDGLLVLIEKLMESLVQYTPTIVGLIFDFLIQIIDATAAKLPDLVKSVVNLIMSLFQGVIEALSTVDPEVLLKGLIGVGILTALMAALAASALLAPAAMIGVIAIGAVIAELALMLAAIGALAQLPGLKWLVSEGGDLLFLMGQAIGKFVGGLVGAVMEGISSSLVQIGADLSMFMVNLTPFILGAKMIDESVLTGVCVLSAAILAVTAADLLAGIASFLQGGTSLSEFGTELSGFMTNIAGFIEGARGLDPSILEGVSALAGAIIKLTAANLLDGITSFISGGTNLEQFGVQIGQLGTGIATFVANVGTFSEDQVTTVSCAAEAIKSLASAAATVPNTGGLLGQLVGENDLSNFAAQFPILGSSLTMFLANIGTFSDEQVATVTCAANAIKILAQASSEIPNTGGLLGQLVGDNGLGSFAIQFPLLGQALSAFLSNIGTFSDEQVTTVTCAANAIKLLAEASSEIPNTGGWLAAIVGDNDLATFASQFPNLGTGLNQFLANLGTFDEEQIATVKVAAEAIKVLAEASSSVPNSGGWLAAIVGDNELGTFADQFPKVGDGIKGFADNLGTFDDETLRTVKVGIKAVKAIADLAGTDLSSVNSAIGTFGTKLSNFGKKLGEFCSNIAEVGAQTLSNAIKKVNEVADMIRDLGGLDASAASAFKKAIEDLGKTGFDKFVDAFTGSAATTDVKNAAKKMVDNFITAAESKSDAIISAFEGLGDDAVDGIKDSEDDFESAGKDLGSGLVRGIEAKETAAYNAGYALGQKAVQGEKDGQQSNSPSKLTYKAGRWIGEGLVNGIVAMGSAVYKAGRNMGEEATLSISNAVAKVRDFIDSDMDTQPTIRPILDLSDVSAGARSISGMFGTNPSMRLLTNVGTISSMMNNQNGGNNEIVSAIDKLSKKMDGLGGGNTYNSINGITYDDGSNISEAMKVIVRQTRIEGRS